MGAPDDAGAAQDQSRGKAFGQEPILAWHERTGVPRPKYVFGLRLTANVRRALAQVPWPLWEGQPTAGLELVAETTVQLQGWSRARRVVFVRTIKPVNAGAPDEFWAMPEEEEQAYVTDLTAEEATAEQEVRLARKRGDAESVFDELKNQWGFLQRQGSGDGDGGVAVVGDVQPVEFVCDAAVGAEPSGSDHDA